MSRTRVPPVPVITGPTASGKTRFALALAERHPEVMLISADSVMVYRGLDIGSGKPDAATLARFPHALVDIRDPSEPYSAAEFARDAAGLIEEARARGRIPVVVGGTMLYLRALMDGLAALPGADPRIRRAIQAQADEQGWAVLHERLAEADPASAARIHPHDAQRIQRALEILELTGSPPAELFRRGGRPSSLDFREYVVAPPDRAELHRRIADRFHAMLDVGLVDEVRGLFRRGDLDEDLPAVRAVGYRQVWGFLAGRYGRTEMVDRALAATRQLAKRQFTWLRGRDQAIWFDAADPGSLDRLLNSVTCDLKL